MNLKRILTVIIVMLFSISCSKQNNTTEKTFNWQMVSVWPAKF